MVCPIPQGNHNKTALTFCR